MVCHNILIYIVKPWTVILTSLVLRYMKNKTVMTGWGGSYPDQSSHLNPIEKQVSIGVPKFVWKNDFEHCLLSILIKKRNRSANKRCVVERQDGKAGERCAIRRQKQNNNKKRRRYACAHTLPPSFHTFAIPSTAHTGDGNDVAKSDHLDTPQPSSPIAINQNTDVRVVDDFEFTKGKK